MIFLEFFSGNIGDTFTFLYKSNCWCIVKSTINLNYIVDKVTVKPILGSGKNVILFSFFNLIYCQKIMLFTFPLLLLYKFEKIFIYGRNSLGV